jgi:hypothetical protein
MIDASNRDVTNGVSSRFEGAGRYGSGQYGGVLSRALLDNESKLRYADYSQERAYQNAAPGQLAGLALSRRAPASGGQHLRRSRPQSDGQLQYDQRNTTSSPAIGPMILQSLAAAPRQPPRPQTFGYDWNWRSEPNGAKAHGVLAHEVKELRPAAYVPNFRGDGYDGVNYGAL